MTKLAEPEVDRQLAMRLAITAAQDVLEGGGYDPAALVSPESKLVLLTLSRKTRRVTFTESHTISRYQLPDEFREACTRAWRFLRGEMDRKKAEDHR